MCGIAGYSRYVDPSRLDAACKVLEHRGPDDFGVYIDRASDIGLGHRRLSILDTSSAGHQPMLSTDGDVVLIFNGEIYNFRELRSGLERQGVAFRGHSDTEVLLNLYLDEGEAMLPRLNGIFAFALWDSRSELLWIARDAYGVKPLYYAQSGGVFAFASELKALYSLLDTSEQPDVTALDRYLTFLWAPGDRTPAKNIRKLGPGEALTVRRGQIEVHSRWFQRPRYYCTNSLTKAQAVQGTEHHLRQAVHRQLIADVPVGAFLSGGLDSSSIVAFAREINPELQCFTIDVGQVASEGFADDLPYALQVAKHLDVPLQVIQMDAAQMVSNLETMVWQLDEPIADLAPLNVFHLCRLARARGIKVMLSGAGGDDLFSGYRRHLALENEIWWRWLPRPIRQQLRSLTAHLPTNHPFTRRLRKAFSGAHLEGDSRLVHYFRWIERADLQALYSPSFRFALGQARAEDPMLEFLAGLPRNIPPLERMLALEQRFFLPDHNLVYTDKMSMAVGVEVRVPFLDPDLVNFSSNIPSQLKHRGRQGKWILKKAMEPYLPKEVIYRSKSGFGAPLRRWLKVELRDWLDDILSVDRLQRRGLFDPHAVQLLIRANSEGMIDASYTLLSLALIEIWCKYFLDGLPSPQVHLPDADS